MTVDELDEALARFQLGQCEYGGGLSNHGPMAAEAIVALGHRALVPGLVERYAPRLGGVVLDGRPIPEAERPSALGDYARLADWVATWDAELAARPFGEVACDGVRLLVDGLIGAAAHGWLRTAHALRALGAADNAIRRHELAMGLGYWAARHARLPGAPGARAVAGRRPADALAEVVPVPAERRKGFLFTEQLAALDGDAAWTAVVESLDLAAFDAEPSAWTSELCAAMADRYLLHPAARIAYVHTVTAPSALRLVLPHLDGETARRAAGAAFQAAAALHAVAASPGEPPPTGPDEEAEALSRSADEIRYRAACSLEEHAIKMAEACLREHAVDPRPVFLRAAADAALRIG
ncbi:MAG: hypothetical protein ACQGVK_21790 [Myxococcota bacterium]